MLEGLENDFETTQKKIIIRLCHRFGIRRPGVEQIYRHFDLDLNDLRNEITARDYSRIQAELKITIIFGHDGWLWLWLSAF